MTIIWIAEGMFSLVLFAWAYKLSRLPNAPKWLKPLSPWPTILWAVVVLVGVLTLQKGYRAAEQIEPTQRAAALASSISFSMKATWAGLFLLIGFAIWLFIFSRKIKNTKGVTDEN